LFLDTSKAKTNCNEWQTNWNEWFVIIYFQICCHSCL